MDLDEIMEKIRSFSRPSQVDCEDLFNFLESAYIKNEPSYKWQIKTNDIYFNILNCLNKISNQNQGIYKRNAIFWIGEIGQTEHLESLSFLVLEKSEDIKERVVSIDKILNKPVNITSVRPEHFEMIISRLFERKGFKNVTLTKPLRDKGIDIFMNSNDFKYFVQCKRISFRENLPEGDVKKFYKDVAEQPDFLNQKSIVVTTASQIALKAKDYIQERKFNNKWQVECITGVELVCDLNKYIKDNKFCLENPYIKNENPNQHHLIF